jgi:hypothetical protein
VTTPTAATDPSDIHLPPAVLDELAGGGDWISSWWSVAALGLLAALGIVWAVRRRRSHRWSWPIWTCASLAVVAALGLSANVVVGYVPNVAAARVALSSWGLVGPPPALEHGSAREQTGGRDQGSVEAVHVPAPDSDRMPLSSLTWAYTPPG